MTESFSRRGHDQEKIAQALIETHQNFCTVRLMPR